jgi:hypothetical protein
MATGQAAGAAAGLSVVTDAPVRNLSYEKLSDALKALGATLA